MLFTPPLMKHIYKYTYFSETSNATLNELHFELSLTLKEALH